MLQETAVCDARLDMFRMIFQERHVHLANVVEAFSDAKCKELFLAVADPLRISVFLDPASDVCNCSVVGNKDFFEAYGEVFSRIRRLWLYFRRGERA